MTSGHRAVVIGVGNEYRRDDGAGLAVVRRLRRRVPDGVDLLISDGEPARLLEDWAGAGLVIVVDAIAGDQPGRLHRVVLIGDDAGQHPRNGVGEGLADELAASSHGFGLGTAVQLAVALGRLPDTLVLHGVEASNFDHGLEFSTEVAGAIEELTAAVLADIETGGQAPRL